MGTLKALLFCLFIGLLPSAGQAQQVRAAAQDHEVFSEPSLRAKKLGILRAGKPMQILSQEGTWAKIRVKVKNQKREAYIYMSPAQARKAQSWGVGAFAGFSYLSQASRIYKDTDGNETEISNLSGTNAHFGLLADWVASPRWRVRAGLSSFRVYMNGNARYRVSVAASDTPVELKQDFYTAFVQPQYQLTTFLNLWIAPLAEIAFCTKSTLFGAESEKPTYFLGALSIGTKHSVGNFYFTPEFRVGAILNSKPAIYNGEFLISALYRF
ncbi:MAG: hypothetical protein AB7F59_11890 [Bdellovibrionales bacterium]